jgi:hypothetical protein
MQCSYKTGHLQVLLDQKPAGASWAKGFCAESLTQSHQLHVLLSLLPVDADACAANPCDGRTNAVNGSCTDLPPPADGTSGFTCSCTSGFQWDGVKCAGKQCPALSPIPHPESF